MSKRKYPREEWIVTAAGVVKPVTLVRQTWPTYPKWDNTASGASYSTEELHPTRKAAIDAGYAAVKIAEARLAKSRTILDKKLANLKKAEATL